MRNLSRNCVKLLAKSDKGIRKRGNLNTFYNQGFEWLSVNSGKSVNKPSAFKIILPFHDGFYNTLYFVDRLKTHQSIFCMIKFSFTS